MTHWDNVAENFDLLKLQDFCDDRLRLGYPPAVGKVDVHQGRGTLLSENDCIGRVRSTDSSVWTFAVPAADRVVPLPNGTSVLIGDWIVDVTRPLHLAPSPVSVLRSAISADDRVIIHDFAFVVCFDETGQRWKSKGLFDGDLIDVRLKDRTIICRGMLEWISSAPIEIELDIDTGQISGGDTEAVKIYQAL